jgi:hypothetical protein
VVAEATAPVVIGTVTPNGNRFIVVIDPRKIPPMFPDYGANARGAAANVEAVRSAATTAALRKLGELFPNGVPPGVASKIKVSVTIKFSKPPEFGVSVEW